MAGAPGRVVREALGGVAIGVRRQPRVFVAATLTILTASILVPPLLLSVVRKPVDYFTVNPWLRRLPEYLLSAEVPLGQKLAKLPALALFWCSADSPFGGTEWGFAVDVTDLGRILLTSLLFGAYFALWAERRRSAPAVRAWTARPGGALGALASVFGLSTGPCSVVGCGAPVLPVVGLAFAGLSSGTLAFLAGLSTVATATVLATLVLAVAYLGWRLGAGEGARPRP